MGGFKLKRFYVCFVCVLLFIIFKNEDKNGWFIRLWICYVQYEI